MIFLKLCTGNAVQNNSTFIILVITSSFSVDCPRSHILIILEKQIFW